MATTAAAESAPLGPNPVVIDPALDTPPDDVSVNVYSATDTLPTASVIDLPRWARQLRVCAAVVVLALLTLGTVHGGDDDFPFGPMRMYATRDNPNGVVQQGVVQAVTRSGRVRDVTNTTGAPRRAELEGRMSEFAAHPSRFATVAAAFLPHDNSVSRDPVVTVRLVRRGFPLRDGRSGPPVDVIIAIWTVRR